MPKVPSYNGLQADISVQPQVQLRAPNTAAIAEPALKQGQAVAEGMSRLGDATSRIALDMQNDANQVRVNDGMNVLIKARTQLQVDLLAQKGKNALERPDGKSLVDEYEDRLGKEIEGLSTGLGNDAQRQAFQQQAAQLRNQFREVATRHMIEQQGEYKRETRQATIATAVSQYVELYGDKDIREQSIGAITSTIDDIAREEGWDPATRAAKLAEAMSPAHAGVIKSLIQSGRASDAKGYYDANSMDMTLQARAAVQEPLRRAVVAQEADAGAGNIWLQLGPKGQNDAIKLFDMEQEARKQYAGDPDKAEAVISRLRSMAQGFNAQQAEVKAENVAGVWKLVDDGVPMSRVMMSDAWMALDDTTQHEITNRMHSEAMQRESRALTADQRELTRLQIKEKLADIRGTETYLTASDPNVLSQMTRAQVEALRGKIGKDQTEALLKKWDEIKKPGKLPIAKMDNADFNGIAEEMGLRGKDDNAKAVQAKVRMDVEAIITEREAALGKPLPREERKAIMRRALASEVMLDRWWGTDVPVSAALVAEDELENVIIPQDQKPLIAEALAAGYEKDPGNPLFAPTPQNMARMYLQRRMREGNQ